MSSVTSRISKIKQPRGGFLKPSDMRIEEQNDGIILNVQENVHASIIGMAVDYLTRFMNGSRLMDAFDISLRGADIARVLGVKNADTIATNLLKNIKGLDDVSIVNACKLVTFDVWFRNTQAAVLSKTYRDTNPDSDTIHNIRTMVQRGIRFIKKYGPITKDGFTFEPENKNESNYKKMIETRKGSYGGYTATVDSGDGDFLTFDTLWDFKVTMSEPTNKHTLQLIMYWIMGKHSGQDCFKNIKKIGIFNPRLNRVYLFEMNKLPNDIITCIEKDIICY